MAHRRVLVLGGARSGKSTFAEKLAGEYASVIYLATGQVTDDEMADRVRRHQASRPGNWTTVEEGYHPAEAIRSRGQRAEAVLVDCVSFLVSNHLLQDEELFESRVALELEAMLALPCDIIFVSNEVGMSVVPEYKLGRLFRDGLGRANQFLASRCDEVYVCWAGTPVDIKRLGVQQVE